MSDNKYVGLIKDRLTKDVDDFKAKFTFSLNGGNSTRYLIIDDFLPESEALEISRVFPDQNEMREMKSFREHKYTSKNFSSFDSRLLEVSMAFQDRVVIDLIEKITGIQNQFSDPSFYAGGLSSMSKGHFLDPHIDNSHEATRQAYRRLNLLYYVTPDWEDQYGGHLELWDEEAKKPLVIHSYFNRLVLMETHALSWHSVCKVKVDQARNCVSNYYFSKESPTGEDYFHITKFSARPEDKAKRMLYCIDGFSRTLLRKIFKQGLGKSDLAK